ncbi:MAG: hypothetical protein H6942_12575 [Candidatus Accumulibacter sp.]|uniref:hypothetical protein n=1 Tax=Accumulibacter sp. TaxID=2053492 RepID=UPI0025E664BE|nr:hypothetical protein [Accumulibacter sp.]MCP5249347.1 hypothetical protein [Accumulibacter sp.]
MAMLVLLTLWGLYLFVGQLDATQLRLANEQRGAAALAEARDSLVSDAISRASLDTSTYYAAGFLVLPDLGSPFEGGAPSEGLVPTLNHTGNSIDRTVIGKFPWKTLAYPPVRDSRGECLWYVVSGRFKIAPKTHVALNWDTRGQIDVLDGGGNVVASDVAALIAAPGRALDGQSRALADAAYGDCGGNYDARNYLDSFNGADAVAGQVNYFVGSTNNRAAPDANNKSFIMAQSDHYNDRFLFITVDDIFDPLIRRSDFAAAIAGLLDDPGFQSHLQTIAITGSKGTGNLLCSQAPDPVFCENWKEMLLLTQLPTASPIVIDRIASAASCSRVLIFGGRKTTAQSRATAIDKANKDNYLENQNAASFGVPMATATNFSGASAFDFRTPTSDLVRCLP